MDPIRLLGAGGGDPAAAARAGEAVRLQQAAQEFEGLFLGLLLKGMRAAGGGALPDGAETRMYRELFDMEVGRSLARAGGIGLARVIQGLHEKSLKAGRPAADMGTDARTRTLVGGSGEDPRR